MFQQEAPDRFCGIKKTNKQRPNKHSFSMIENGRESFFGGGVNNSFKWAQFLISLDSVWKLGRKWGVGGGNNH